MKDKMERGAVVVEATLCLTAFVFAIVMVLTIVNIAYAQAKIGTALDYAAKEMSQYSYLYFKLGIDEWDANISDGTGDSQELAESTIDGIVEVTDSLSDAESAMNECDIEGLVAEIENGANSVEGLVDRYSEAITGDPKGFAMGMGKLAVSELKEEVKVVLGQVLAKSLMKKNLKAYVDEEPENFLHRMHVVRESDTDSYMSALSFDGSYLMPAGSNSIQLVCSYEIQVLQLLNVDFKFKFTQCAKTSAWGRGVSEITPKSIWDTLPNMDRGKYIVGQEKQNYSCTSSRNGFDAYDESSNQFVSIFSMDNITNTKYQNVDEVYDRLEDEFGSMYNGVKNLPEDIRVRKDGQSVTVQSDPGTRTYKLVIVIPDDGDKTVINQAIDRLKQEHPDISIDCEIKGGYGNPKVETESDDSGDGGAA